MTLEYLKNWFEREDDRRIALENSLSIPIAILTAVFAVQFYSLSDYDFIAASNTEIVFFLALITTSNITALITIFFLFKSYHNLFTGFKYTSLPLPADLVKYKKELVDYFNANATYYGGINGDEKFTEYLTEKYIEHCGRNTQNNDQKSLFLYKSKGFMLASIISLLLALIPFLVNFFHKPEQLQRVEITNLLLLEKRLDLIEKILKENGRRIDTTATATTAKAPCR